MFTLGKNYHIAEKGPAQLGSGKFFILRFAVRLGPDNSENIKLSANKASVNFRISNLYDPSMYTVSPYIQNILHM